MPTTTTTHTLLIAHADTGSRTALAAELDLDGYRVLEARTTTTAVAALARETPGLILLGTLERPAAAPQLLRDLRGGRVDAVDAAIPVLTLGASDDAAQLRAYDDGSDHHLTPDAPHIIVRAIVAAVIRRAGLERAHAAVLEFGALTIDAAAREARIAGATVRLTAREFDLLALLASDPERVFRKAELLADLWGYEAGSTRTVDSHVSRLRRRLGEHGVALIRTQWGIGYRLAP